jgi:hypothetical protein
VWCTYAGLVATRADKSLDLNESATESIERIEMAGSIGKKKKTIRC